MRIIIFSYLHLLPDTQSLEWSFSDLKNLVLKDLKNLVLSALSLQLVGPHLLDEVNLRNKKFCAKLFNDCLRIQTSVLAKC